MMSQTQASARLLRWFKVMSTRLEVFFVMNLGQAEHRLLLSAMVTSVLTIQRAKVFWVTLSTFFVLTSDVLSDK